MKIETLELGSYGTNCYIAINEQTKKAVIVDPGAQPKVILDFIKKNDLTIDAILITHGHHDHIGAVGAVREATKAPVMVSEGDAGMLTDANKNLSVFMGEGSAAKAADRLLKDGDKVEAAGFTFDVLATPGHTPGGICFKNGDVIFVGDTIFSESIGRTDFPGGSYPQIIESIKNKLFVLADEVHLLPGHGPATTVGWERRMNPFLQ